MAELRGQISMLDILGDPQRSLEDEGLAEDLRIACYQNREQLLEGQGQDRGHAEADPRHRRPEHRHRLRELRPGETVDPDQQAEDRSRRIRTNPLEGKDLHLAAGGE